MLNRSIDQLPKRLMMIITLSGSRVSMLNFVWTNHVCKRSLLFRCVSSENSLKICVQRYCQRNFRDNEYLCKLDRIFKHIAMQLLHFFSGQNLQTFDISHAFLYC